MLNARAVRPARSAARNLNQRLIGLSGAATSQAAGATSDEVAGEPDQRLGKIDARSTFASARGIAATAKEGSEAACFPTLDRADDDRPRPEVTMLDRDEKHAASGSRKDEPAIYVLIIRFHVRLPPKSKLGTPESSSASSQGATELCEFGALPGAARVLGRERSQSLIARPFALKERWRAVRN